MKRVTALVIGLLGLAPLASAAESSYQLVAHASTPGSQIRRDVVRAIFLGEATRWADGTQVRPIDQSLRSQLRARFCESALGHSVSENGAYWHQRVSSARVFPPPVKTSDDDVIAFVRANKGAIGYVSGDVTVGDDVKVLKIVD
jgi:ABC-type phosphate transport system substrate-binding protein